MRKALVQKLSCIGVIFMCVLAVRAVRAQDMLSERTIGFTISGDTAVCSEKDLVLTASVTNGTQQTIEVGRKLWRYRVEKALDQNSAIVVGSNFPLKVPVMRGTITEEVQQSKSILLDPTEKYSQKITISPLTDDFYRKPGRYSIKALLPLTGSDDKNIFSNEFFFDVAKCSARGLRMNRPGSAPQ